MGSRRQFLRYTAAIIATAAFRPSPSQTFLVEQGKKVRRVGLWEFRSLIMRRYVGCEDSNGHVDRVLRILCANRHTSKGEEFIYVL